MRHGKPTVSLQEKISGNQFRSFVERYNAAKITSNSKPSGYTLNLIQDAKFIFTSDLARTIDSARILDHHIQPISKTIFRELNCWLHFPTDIKLSAFTWVIISRILWEIGYHQDCESPKQARQRAKKATELLIEQHQCTGSVLLIAHGGINILIATHLRKMGWRGPRNPDGSHWGITTYIYGS